MTQDPRKLTEISKKVRRQVLKMIYETRSAHLGSSLSSVDILVSLYFGILNTDPSYPAMPERDRFLMSKGHGCPAWYATLYERGFIDQEILSGFAVDGGSLEHHPNKMPAYGIDFSSGSLGHALSVACGICTGAKYRNEDYHTFVLMSDGETQEGSVWEAAMFAAQHNLDHLVAIVDYNKIQALGRTDEVISLEPIEDKWRAFGWHVTRVDGHDIGQLCRVLDKDSLFPGQPNMIIADTLKGKGVSFMEDKLLWHYRCPSEEEYLKALEELK